MQLGILPQTKFVGLVSRYDLISILLAETEDFIMGSIAVQK